MRRKNRPATRLTSTKHFSNYAIEIDFNQSILTIPLSIRCKVCEMHFLSSNNLDRHIKQAHELKEFKCQHMFCVDSFATQKLLDEHFAANHSRTECPHCKKMILETYIAQHIRDRHEAEKRGIICELCGKISLNKQTHRTHYQTVHDDSEKLQCDMCGRW